MVTADHIGVQIWPADGYDGHIQEDRAVPITIGGKGGLFDERANQAAVQVGPGMLVVFELSGPYPAKPTEDLKDILASVTWAPDPEDDATWPMVADWAK